MEIRLCKKCNEPIPETRRADAIFCCDKCGWMYRNRQKSVANKEKQLQSKQLNTNYNIIKYLYGRSKLDVSTESLELMGFDFEAFTGIADIDTVNRTTEYKLFEFSFMIKGERIIIKKIYNGHS